MRNLFACMAFVCFGLFTHAQTTSIYFASGKSDLQSKEKEQLDQFIHSVETNSKVVLIRITGYADPKGNSQSNESLSLKRAEVVRTYLQSKGLKIKIELNAKGELNQGSSEDQLATARRVDITAITTSVSPKQELSKTTSKELPAGEKSRGKLLTDNYRKEWQEFKIDPSKDVELVCAEGTKIRIKANSFELVKPKEFVVIRVQEYYTKGDFIRAGLTTLTTNGEILESGGMVNINALQQGVALKLKQGTTFDLLFPYQEGFADMQTFYGKQSNGNMYWEPAKEGGVMESMAIVKTFDYETGVKVDTVDWSKSERVFSDRGSSKEGKSSPKEEKAANAMNKMQNVLIKSSRMGFINCDHFLSMSRTLTSVSIKGDKSLNQRAYLLFKGDDCLMPGTLTLEGNWVFENIPIGLEVIVILLEEGKTSETNALGMTETLIGKDMVIMLNMQEKPIGEIEKIFDKL